MGKLLFHICCAPCGYYLAKNFFKDFETTLFFYNPNIWPKEEYEKRLNEVKKIAKQGKIELIEGEYDNKNWFDLVHEYKKEKEGGKRCEICFKIRLKETAKTANKLKIINFSTSLAISPFKDLIKIKKIGENIAKKYNLKFIIFTPEEKDNLWQATENFAQQEHFYHQNYCGCLYSLSLLKYLKICYNNTIQTTRTYPNPTNY